MSVKDADIAIDYLANRGYQSLAFKSAYLAVISENSNIRFIFGITHETRFGPKYDITFGVELEKGDIDITKEVFKDHPTIF